MLSPYIFSASDTIDVDVRSRAIGVPIRLLSCFPYALHQCAINSSMIKPSDFSQLKQDIQTIANDWFEGTRLLGRLED